MLINHIPRLKGTSENESCPILSLMLSFGSSHYIILRSNIKDLPVAIPPFSEFQEYLSELRAEHFPQK